MDSDLSHLRHDLFQSDGFVVKAFSVDQIRIVPGLDRTIVVLLPELFPAIFFLAAGTGSAGVCDAFFLPFLCLSAALLLIRRLRLQALLHCPPFKDRIDLLLNPLFVIFAV